MLSLKPEFQCHDRGFFSYVTMGTGYARGFWILLLTAWVQYDLYVQLMLDLTKTTKWPPAVKLQHHKLCITFSLESACIQLVMQKKWINIFIVQSNLLLRLFYVPGIADTITQIRRLKPFITKNK